MFRTRWFGERSSFGLRLRRSGKASSLWLTAAAAATVGGATLLPLTQNDSQPTSPATSINSGDPIPSAAPFTADPYMQSPPPSGFPGAESTIASRSLPTQLPYPSVVDPSNSFSAPSLPGNQTPWTTIPQSNFAPQPRSSFADRTAAPITSFTAEPRGGSMPLPDSSPTYGAPVPSGSDSFVGTSNNYSLSTVDQTATSGSVASISADRRQVDLYYATDRKKISPTGIDFWLPIVAPAVIAATGTLIAFAAFFFSRVKWLWGIASIGGVAAFALTAANAVQKANMANAMLDIGGVFFAGQRNDAPAGEIMNYGKARVTLPPDHQKGQVERPSVFRFELRESEDRHVMIRKIEPLEASSFFASMDASIASARDPSVLMFVHGYNVGFEDALHRTAQIAADLAFEGVPMLYSWPSAGRLTGYTADENTVDWSVTHLEELLLDVRRRTRASTVHVIVHSMGNRVLLGAVERLTLRYPAAQPMLGQVIMAAPDVDLANFESRYHTAITQAARRVTVYASSGDRALQASMALHGYQRLGLSHNGMRTFVGLDTVDVSGLDTSLLGHSYYGSQHDLIRDIRAIIELNEPPLKRKWLQAVAGPVEPTLWRLAGDVYVAKQLQPIGTEK